MSLALVAQPLALELHETLRQLDPARWRADQVEGLRTRLASLRARFAAARAAAKERHDDRTLRSVAEVADTLDEPVPASSKVEAWVAFRARVAPAYEGLVKALRDHSVRLPSLRPTNYVRSFFHVLNGVVLLLLLAFVPASYLVIPATCAFVLVWLVEGTRRLSPAWNARVMKLFGPVAHAYEYEAINSGTWYVSAVFVLAWIANPGASAAALAVLALADPAAGFVGRRYGRIRLVGGRSLEGSAAFALVAFVAALVVLSLFSAPFVLATALACALSGALAELLSGPIDDNFSIPVVVALTAVGLQAFLPLVV